MDAQQKEALKREKEGRLAAEEARKIAEDEDKLTKRSTRQQELKEKREATKELPQKDIDWEKITPEEREKMRAKYLKQEKTLNKLIMDLQHGIAITPLGRDRTFRRFWVFKSVPGIFVEDNEDFISEDCLHPIAQVKRESEEKSNSDKENESFDSGKGSDNVIPNGLDCVKSEISKMSLHDQIAQHNQHRWMYYHTAEQMHALIDSLNPRGYREGPLRQVLTEQKALLTDCMAGCPVKVLSISEAEEEKCQEQRARFQQLKSRKRMSHGVVVNNSAQEFLELNLREMILDIEERIYHGTLGSLQVRLCS
jgi:bromodomain adjacent to zinc finger domain protein 1A